MFSFWLNHCLSLRNLGLLFSKAYFCCYNIYSWPLSPVNGIKNQDIVKCQAIYLKVFIQCFFDSSPKYELKELCISHLSLNNSGLKQYTYITSQLVAHRFSNPGAFLLGPWVPSITGCSQLKAPLWRILFESHWRIQFHDWSCSSS